MPQTNTLLTIIAHDYTHGQFTKISGYNLPTAFDLGYIPGLLSKFSFNWAGAVLSLSPWQEAIAQIQAKYKKVFIPKHKDVVVISAKALENQYKIGVDHNGQLALFLIQNKNHESAEFNITMSLINCDGGSKIVIKIETETTPLPNCDLSVLGLNIKILSSQALKFISENLGFQRSLDNEYDSGYNKTTAHINVYYVPAEDLNYKLFLKSAITKYKEDVMPGTHIIEYKSQHESVLVRAIQEQWPLEAVRTLLALGANLRQLDKTGMLPHHHAALHDNETVLKLFIETDPELLDTLDTTTKRSALSFAAHKRAKNCVRLLLERGAKFNGVSDNKHTDLQYAILGNSRETIEIMLEQLKYDKDNWRSPHPKHPTLFHVAIDNKHPRIHAITTLLQNGQEYDYNASEELNVLNEDGLSAFHLLIQKGSLELINNLLPYADILQPTHGNVIFSVRINKYAPELAWHRVQAINQQADEGIDNSAIDQKNRAIFALVFENFLHKANVNQLEDLWKKLKPQLDTEALRFLTKNYQDKLEKISLLLPVVESTKAQSATKNMVFNPQLVALGIKEENLASAKPLVAAAAQPKDGTKEKKSRSSLFWKPKN